MARVNPWVEATNSDVGSDIYEFRAEALRVVLTGLLFVAFAVAAAVSVDHQTPLAMAGLTPVFLALSLGGRALLSSFGATFAASATVVALVVSLSAAICLHPFSESAVWFCLVVIVASVTLGNRASLVVAATSMLIILVAWLGPSPVVSGEVATPAIGLIVATAVLGWLASNPVYVALEWAWHSYERARVKTEELRDRQGELGRVVKSLNEAYARLEALNDELARARRAAEEARRLKSEFTANISHELRTPLNLIIGFSEMMATSPESYGDQALPSTYRSDLDAILRNARHLSNLIDDVLDLSQIEAGRMGLAKEELALGEVIAEAAGAVSRLVSGKGLELAIRVPDDLPLVYADRTRIRQVLINLLSNATRFTDRGGITIAAAVDGGDVHVSVADTGVGISAGDVAKVFEAFRQLDGSIRRREAGSGLGLAVSKQFVELHGGAMWAESRVGEGTVFHFTLPLSGNVVTASGHSDWQVWDRVMATRAAPLPEVRVVSADPSVPRILQRHLGDYRVTGHPSLAQLIEARRAEPRRESAHGQEVCIVVTSSPDEAPTSELLDSPSLDGMTMVTCALPGKRDAARDLGVAAYLVKPISGEQLASAVAQLGPAPRSVLIVDDDDEMLRLLGRWVRPLVKRRPVWLAGGGDEALAILRSKKPGLVLLDLAMPGVDGQAVLAEMRADERLRDVPVIVVTARDRERDGAVTGLISITRQGGLSMGELVRCLQASLKALQGVGTSGSAREPGRGRLG